MALIYSLYGKVAILYFMSFAQSTQDKDQLTAGGSHRLLLKNDGTVWA